MPITSRVEAITPVIAQQWLDRGDENFRRTDKARVINYAAEMLAGRWHLNGETIKFSGELVIDGKHRLHAVVRSGITIQSVVVRGITSDASHIDRGKPRTVSQWVAHSGAKNAILVAAAARMCVAHDKGIWHQSAWGCAAMTDSEVIDFALAHHESINASCGSGRISGLSRALVATILFIGCGRKDASKNGVAVWFRDALFSGENLTETDPVLHLRNRLLKQNRGVMLTRFMTRALLTLAWNKTVAGLECSASGLRIRMTGPQPQSPPSCIFVVGKDD